MNKLFAILTVVVFLAASADVRAQPDAEPPPMPENGRPALPAGPDMALEQRVADLERQVGSLRAELDSVRRDHERDLQALNRLVTANAEAIRTTTEMVRANAEAIGANTQRIGMQDDRIDSNSRLIDATNRVAADNSRKLNDISRLDEQGNYRLDVLGNVQRSESFRREFQQVSQGRVWIYNPDPFDNLLYVNGARWLARPGWSYVWAPVGPVSISEAAGVTPELRRDWHFNEDRQQFELVYDPMLQR